MVTPTVTLVDDDDTDVGLAVVGCVVGEIDPSDTGGVGAEFKLGAWLGCLLGALVGALLGTALGKVRQPLGSAGAMHFASDCGRHSSKVNPAAACHASATPSAATPIARSKHAATMLTEADPFSS
jgi:hypothetical protein